MRNQLSLILLIVGSCGCIFSSRGEFTNMTTAIQEKPLYKVYKIDSIRNYYLIYVRKKDTLYKIVSEKTALINCNLIRINQEYDFKLTGRIASRQASKFKLSPKRHSW